jgi:hypothetical protein
MLLVVLEAMVCLRDLIKRGNIQIIMGKTLSFQMEFLFCGHTSTNAFLGDKRERERRRKTNHKLIENPDPYHRS